MTLLAIPGLIAGIFLLVRSSDFFVEGAAALARHWKMPPLLIGMVVIGFGTSAPEMIVSLFAALQDAPLLALGNAYGSNIANIGLILGIAALIAPITVHRKVLWREMPVLLIITGLTWFLLGNSQLSRSDGWILLGVFALLLTLSVVQALRDPEKNAAEAQADIPDITLPKALLYTLGGLIVLILSSRLLVWSAIQLARWFGVSDLIIGLTVVAIGTSLPELMSTISAMRKGEDDLALGNIIGSNFFNTLIVVGIAVVIKPIEPEDLPATLRIRDVSVMSALTVLLFIACIYGKYRVRHASGKRGFIGRLAGSILLSSYIAYTAWLITHAT